MWTKHRYGNHDSGHWTITDGLIRFDIHPLYDGSGGHKLTDGVILSPKKTDLYAELIVDALNHHSYSSDCLVELKDEIC
jgi:hypothetical protein